MTVYFPWENEPIEKVKKKIMGILPPIPQPPTPQETGEAWGKVITETPEYALPFAPKVDVKQLGKALVGTASAVASTPGLEFLQPLQIRAFHGSPYKFSKFENKAIGTGEGVQAFGYGHYVSDSEEVANQYARNLAKTKKADEIVNKHYTGKGTPESIEPRVYETTIHKGKQPSEYTYLEWDKPISKEHWEVINKQTKKEGIDLSKPEGITESTGTSGFYDWKEIKTVGGLIDFLGNKLGGYTPKGKQSVSDFLQRAGFSGIKYPTGSLSKGWSFKEIMGKKEGEFDIWQVKDANDNVIKSFTGPNSRKESAEFFRKNQPYNYVVFNPEDITIESVLPPGIEKK